MLHVNWLFKNIFGEPVKCYVLLDRDYYPQVKIDEITNNLIEKKVRVHVWRKKEIENYLINFQALYRIFLIKYGERPRELPNLSFNEFSYKLSAIIDGLKNDVRSQLLSHLIKNSQNPSIDLSILIKNFSIQFESSWNDLEVRKDIISEKEFFSNLNRWLSEEYHMSLSIHFIINKILCEEIDGEMISTINEFMDIVNTYH